MPENERTRTRYSRRGFLGAAAAAVGANAGTLAPMAEASTRQSAVTAQDRLAPTGLMTALQDNVLGVATQTPAPPGWP